MEPKDLDPAGRPVDSQAGTPTPLGQSILARATLPAVLATRAVSDNTQQKKAINL
jgi:hypothetical protein